MGFLKKLFGDKATRDNKALQPILQKTLAAYDDIVKLDIDAIRHKTVEFQEYIKNKTAAEVAEIAELKPFVGRWKYQASSGNYTVDKGAKDIARLTINDDATYKYYDSDNNITTGDIKVRNEEYADGQAVIVIEFYDGDEVRFSTYYEGNYNVLSIGNGGMARFMRVN